MAVSDSLTTLREELSREVTEHLLPYWTTRTIDEQYGGFVGRIDAEDKVVEEALKAAVLNTRILWTFAAAARVLDHERCRTLADRAYAYIVERFWDDAHEGIYWMVDHTGEPIEERKQIYAQAFAVYAFAEYHRATGHAGALDQATQLFRLLEAHSFDREWGGYYEAFSRDWKPLDAVRLSENDPDEKKSMNTHLHIMEAYANLYRVWEHSPLATQLRALVDQFLDVIVDAETAHLIPFFSVDWMPRSTSISFGHDIEASWLLSEAAEVLGQASLEESARKNAVRMAGVTLREGVDSEHGVIFEAEPDGVTNPDRHWWPQAEAVVGFLNAYQISGEERFRNAALNSWRFIQRHLVDRENGEWRRRVSPNGTRYNDDKVGPWKGPYHGVRACLEGVRRIGQLDGSDDRWPEHVSRSPTFDYESS